MIKIHGKKKVIYTLVVNYSTRLRIKYLLHDIDYDNPLRRFEIIEKKICSPQLRMYSRRRFDWGYIEITSTRTIIFDDFYKSSSEIEPVYYKLSANNGHKYF